jgi:hypothetical protein
MSGYVASALAGIAAGLGLCFDYRFLPHPDQTAAAPVFIAADIADRQKCEERYLRRVTIIRLARLGLDGGDQ